jgi:hypothetical protein
MPRKKKHNTGAAAFVRTLPLDVPVAEVIARAQAEGIAVKPHNVWQTRLAMKREGKAPEPERKPARAAARVRASNGHAYSPDEVALMRLALGIGVPRAAALLEVAQRASLKALDQELLS